VEADGQGDGQGLAPTPARPEVARRPRTLDVHGVERVDDFVWLRVADDPETIAHLRSEQDFYDRTISRLAPIRVELEAEMTSRLPVADASVAWRRGGVVYFTRSCRGE
jgi:oligopeptidase B